MCFDAREALSEEDIVYVWQVLVKFWIKEGFGEIAQDLAQEGVMQAWIKSHLFRSENGASIRTFSVRVGINRGWDIVRKDLRRKTIFDENLDAIARKLGEGEDPDLGLVLC